MGWAHHGRFHVRTNFGKRNNFRTFILTDSIDTESLSARGRSVWVHSSRVGFLDSRVPCNSLPATVGQD